MYRDKRLKNIFPSYYMRKKDTIIQIDLVINWQQLRDDYVSRHLRITTSNNQQYFVQIAQITPTFYNKLYKDVKENLKIINEKNIKISLEKHYPINLSALKDSYTLNPLMLRAVLNGYGIDMED